MKRFGNCACAGKNMLGNALSWYSGRCLFRNGPSTRALDRVLGETLPRQMTGGSEARPSPLDDSHRANRLRLELVDGGSDELFRDASSLEVVSDQCVSCPSLGESRGAAASEASVVDRAHSDQARHCVLASRRSHMSARKAIGQLLLAQIAPRQRSRGLRHRLVAHELAPHPPRPRPVELDADIQPRRENGLLGQRSPMLPVEGDLDAPAGPREKRANSWRRPLRGQLRPPWP